MTDATRILPECDALGIPKEKLPPESQVVWTDGNIGMTAADADTAIAILKEQPHVR